ncbi:Putative glycosyl/glycerophosphate transferase [Nitrosotalea devaniterrae]|uniref:Glycosyl/glycerophosphate transferase n=1 Tax=Nitrosotalea devaniterrae TaxID=1078905 RepID=A0A128A0M6_9ARCH|nr:Putative glycosyl/glycerophosphate transferase [Candidatus Nitrosotalea devanaterra]
MPRFEIILDCKSKNADVITDYVRSEITDNFTIITDDKSLKDHFCNNGIHAETILENIPTNSNEEQRIYQTVWENMKLLETSFAEIKDNGVEVFLGFRHQIHDELIMLEKLYSILISKKKNHIVFCLSSINAYYYACIGIASSLGYIVSWPLKIKHNTIVTMESLPNTRQLYICEILYHNRLPSIKKIITYLWERAKQFLESKKHLPSQHIKAKVKMHSLSSHDTSSETKIISSALKLQNAIRMEINATRYVKMNDDKSRLKLIEKLNSFEFKNRPCLFYLSTNDMDLYLKPVYPIIEQFKKIQYPYIILTHDQNTKDALSQKNIDFFDYQPYLYDFGYDLEIVKKMIQATKKIASQNDSMISIYFQFFLNDEFFFELINKLRLIRLLSLLVSRLNSISIFVMPDNIGEQLMMCEVAKQYKIKTVSTLANLISPTARSVGHMGAEIIATYGEDCNVSLTKMGYDEDKLVMTGNPRYDNIKNLDPITIRESLSKKIEIDFDRPIILIATSGYDEKEVDWMLDAISYANKKDYEIIIKFHPLFESERSQILLERSKGMKFHFLKYSDIEINEVISVSKVVITDNSSTGMLAILADRPVIVVNFRGEPYPDNRYDEYGIALLAISTQELELCIDKTMNDKHIQNHLAEHRKKYQYWYNYKNDGMAAARIFEMLTSQSSKEVI